MSDWRKLIIACGWNNPDACSLTEQRLAELCAKREEVLKQSAIELQERIVELEAEREARQPREVILEVRT